MLVSKWLHLQIDCDGRVWIVLQVHGKHLLTDIVVIQLVIAQSHVDVECQMLPVVEQDPLVDVDGLLVVRPQVVNGGER